MLVRNLTEGRPLPQILRFALPLLLGNLFQQTYSIVDAAIVGRCLGENALAGVGASSSVQFLVLGFSIGTCSGFGVPIAQHFGAGNHKALKSCAYHALILSAWIAGILTLVCAIACGGILHLLHTPNNIYENAYSYLLIIFLGLPFTLLYNLLSGILRAIGDSRTPFLFLALSTVLNIVLDLMSILLWHMGVTGAALATIVSQAVSGILCGIYILRHVPTLWLTRDDMRFQPDTARNMLLMGVPMGLQSSITAIGSMVMQSSNNALGSVYVSGFTAGMKLKQFAMCPFDALSIAVSTFCGQNLGAKQFTRIRQGLRIGFETGVIYGAFAGLILIFLGRPLSTIFVTAPDVLDASAQYLRALGMFYWVIGFLAIARMTTQGLGFTGLAVISGVLEMVARVAVSTTLVPRFGFNAVCFTDQSAWILATLYIVPTCLICVRRLERGAARSIL